MQSQERRSLKKRIEGEFKEDFAINKLIETLIKSFLRSESDYGAITDIKADVDHVFRLVREYISRSELDICALKVKDSIFMSKTNVHFDEIYRVIRERSQLMVRRGIVEIWDDQNNRILHFLIMPLRKHFPIDYESIDEREEIEEILLKEYSEYSQ